MRFLLVTIALLLVLTPPGIVAQDKDVKPISPEAAAKKIDEKCTVEMKVASTGKSGKVFFLNSKADYRDEGNITVFINMEGVESFKQAKIDDLAAHFKDKTILVTGTVVLYQERPEIIVEKSEQVRIVEKKDKKAPDKK